jgi:phosphatidylglycerophosphatase A
MVLFFWGQHRRAGLVAGTVANNCHGLTDKSLTAWSVDENAKNTGHITRISPLLRALEHLNMTSEEASAMQTNCGPFQRQLDSRMAKAERSTSDFVALLLGQWFAFGRSPKAPGTVGSLGAVPLFWVLKDQNAPLYWGATLAVTLVGFWASQRCSVVLGEKDPQSVVIDEVAGVLIAMGFVAQAALPLLTLAWLLFRLFDITKPSLIDRAQYLKPNGVGIMADDLLAGLLAGLIAWTVHAFVPG